MTRSSEQDIASLWEEVMKPGSPEWVAADRELHAIYRRTGKPPHKRWLADWWRELRTGR